MLPAGGGVSQQGKDHPQRAFQGRKAESRVAGVNLKGKEGQPGQIGLG